MGDGKLGNTSFLAASKYHGKVDFLQQMVCFQIFSYSFSLPAFFVYSECVLV